MSMMKIEVIDRRTFLIGAGASAATLAALSNLAHATPDQAAAFLAKLTGGAQPAEGKVKLVMPEIAENGATVPTEVSADSPMTEKDYCKSISIISTKNPKPHICTFHFTPRSGKAVAKIRVRMAETQEVWAVAQMSDGKWYIGKTTVKVTIGGCGG
ncbi:thiosulfate oxidation carrier protein SoxY [Thermopetrobacter sp. TC1]|uniref:thiosulfate oxidation carrier protein SoxY n=1 Tax=Thermopetrobacter sp. TC1 TaxID=1495045 RepID=UPI0009E038C2|nr:thiosulfate oxidation carrier protein SoxY [Thermopetrobacter sp. TC1]